MFKVRHNALTTLLDELKSLPDTVDVFALDTGWLVVSQSGLFVFTADDGDLSGSCLRAAQAADAIRLRLSDQLVWVPFVDAMCATSQSGFDPAQPCLVIPADLIAYTVMSGPRTIDDETLSKLSLLGLPRLR